MQPRERTFRIAALAWLVTAGIRVAFAILQIGPEGPGGSLGAYLVGATVGVAVAALLWLRPTRASAIVACALGFYAVVGLAYAPLIGPQPWFIALSLVGIVAFALSVAAFFASRPRPGSGA